MIDRVSATASIAVRHAGAYVELILSDLDLMSSMVRGRLLAATVMWSALFLAATLACVAVIAVAWDTPGRMWAIGGLVGLSLLLALGAFWRLRVLDTDTPALLSRTMREWAKDRRLLEELLHEPSGNAVIVETDARVQAARRELQRNREELRAAFAAAGPAAQETFPRSATFRWISGHLTARSLASAAVAAVMLRPSWLRLAGRMLLAQRARYGKVSHL